jgi:hypothetical protein
MLPLPLFGARPLPVPSAASNSQGQLTELSDGLVSRAPLISYTCNVAEHQLPKGVQSYAASLEAAAQPVHRLLASAGRLEAVLAVQEARAKRRVPGS